MLDVMKQLNKNIALPAERLQHAVPWIAGTVNIAVPGMTAVYYLRSIEPTVYCEQ